MDNDYYVLKKDELEKEIENLKIKLSHAPDGTIVALKKDGCYRWYHQKKNKEGFFERKYLGKKDEDLAKRLAQKAYSKALLRDKENELSCVKGYIKKRKPVDYGTLLNIWYY